jgi:hypothetical protein
MRHLDVGCVVEVSEVHVASIFRVEVCIVSECSISPENGLSVYSTHCLLKRILYVTIFFSFKLSKYDNY